MVEQQDPRKKIGVPNLASCSINSDAALFLVVWRAGKIQSENMHFVSLIDKSLG
jgi:hypothetical protein